MSTEKSSLIQPTLADAFDVGRKEGLKEAFTEIKEMLPQGQGHLRTYVEARLKSILDFEQKNPFKQE